MADEERQEAEDNQGDDSPKDEPKEERTEGTEHKDKGTKSTKGKGSERRDSSDETKTPQARAEASDGRARQREFFKEELKRLEESLKKESSKIIPPPRKKNTPFIFNSLAPYYDTQTTRFLLNLHDGHIMGHTSRRTAQGLCDPWVDLHMDKDVLPAISPQHTTIHEPKKTSKHHGNKQQEHKNKQERKEDDERMPLFPIVTLETKDLATRQLYYSDVPMLRKELRTKYSSQAQQKVEADYKRTRRDFYRLDLDKIDQVPPGSRQHMTSTYLAYLQNTPGSRRAVNECVRSLGIQEQAN